MKEFVGVIGGMGPEATILYLDRVTKRTLADTDQDHLNLDCIQHCAIPDRTDYILDNTKPNPLPPILRDIALLTERGATLIAIPCNTAHYFFDQLQASTNVPVLNMIQLTVDELFVRFPAAKRIGVLGTRGTVNSGLYQRAIEAAGAVAVNPSGTIQNEVDGIIFDEVKGGLPLNPERYRAVLSAMAELGCDVSIIGCTELSVPEHKVSHRFPTIDALEVLAEQTILRAGKTLRPKA